MATEEVGKPPSLPPYPKMIVEAIVALTEKDGANKSAISKYIESNYGDLPAGHSNLLSAHLTRMKESGELIFLKNNYLMPDPGAPPRRGRGRPPKPKDSVAPGTEASPPKPRGRPKKDPNAPPAAKKPKPAVPPAPVVSKTGRPRGRPRKVKPQSGALNGGAVEGS